MLQICFTTNHEAALQLAVVAKGFEIVQPMRSECGRFEVDPQTEYGISPELAQAITRLNELLELEKDVTVTPSVAQTQASQPLPLGTCPMCGGIHLDAGPVEIDGADAYQEVTCSSCGAAWNDLYRLTGYEVTEEGNLKVAAVNELREKIEAAEKAVESAKNALETIGSLPVLVEAIDVIKAEIAQMQASIIAAQNGCQDSRYAAAIIGNKPDHYDAIEIHGVREIGHDPQTGKSLVDVDEDAPHFWSVYLHRKEGGIECVGDLCTHELAVQYANELSQKYGYRFG